MKVQGPYGARALEPNRRKPGGGGSAAAFNRLLEESEVDGPAPLSRGVTGVRAIEGVFAAQEVDPDGSNAKRRARARADKLLSRLEALRMALLTGDLPADCLPGLIEAIQQERPYVQDPDMTALLDEIDLRAQVELAKLDL